jgi:hypothetical protein
MSEAHISSLLRPRTINFTLAARLLCGYTLLWGQILFADTLTFLDVGNDAVTFSTTGRGVSPNTNSASCRTDTTDPESCTIWVAPPGSDYKSVDYANPVTGYIAGNGDETAIYVSDSITFMVLNATDNPSAAGWVSLIFKSDYDFQTAVPCAQVGGFFGCGLQERDELQSAGSIDWVNSKGEHVLDKVMFLSTDAPEPTSLILLFTVLLLAGRSLKRKTVF